MSLALAIDTGDKTQLPSRRDEAWRWSDLAGQILDMPATSPVGEAKGEGPFSVLANCTTVVVNGRGAKRIDLLAGQTVALRFVSSSEGTAHAAQMVVTVQGKATLLESYEGQATGYLAHAGLRIDVSAGASLERIVLADDAADAITVSLADVTLAPGASFAQTVLISGAKRQRIETHLEHPGGGANVRMDGAYLISGRRHGDITTVVDHVARDGTTNQLIKGMVRDQGRAVFQGKIVVAHGADGTDARMGHHALILSDRAEVDAKPELLIFADDVQCAHGNSIGALDQDALFYARQRGLPLDEAKTILTAAFVAEVVDRIEHEGARAIAAAWTAARLEQG